MKWTLPILFMGVLVLNCQPPLPDGLEKLTYLPDVMRENSGMEVIPGSDLIWMINDSGNKDHLYGLNVQGSIEANINIKNASNRDWEDLTADEEGNLYIAEIGNNNFNRDELYIYKVPNPGSNPPDELKAEQIEFTYPGHKKDQPYNAEALVYFKGKLYIFTKNKTDEKKAVTYVFSVPATPGTYKARPVGKTTLCDSGSSCRVTAADISPDGKTLALLSHDKIWLSENRLEQDSIAPFSAIDLKHRTQKEGICFPDNETLYISDERDHGSGGILYRFKLNTED
ncbi:hypothetical protein [Robertkochia sediminum]|uniref:hypothetical protein n=1 Tax=Robertkochia sediminum TaxID=2785326 RepID=UPI001931B558|nr:hypothetical protein [Robertkochia sediminum]MBL7474006.1 hypothetical protein [Robertkochia sediminum]